MVQHVDSSGTRLLGNNATRLFDGICMGTVWSDKAGGFFMYFRNWHRGPAFEAQRYRGNLTRYWTTETENAGERVVDWMPMGPAREITGYVGTDAATDGNNGMFVVGDEVGSSVNWVQWVDSTGRARLTRRDSSLLEGQQIYRDSSGFRYATTVRMTSPGEAFITWNDTREPWGGMRDGRGESIQYLTKVTTRGLATDVREGEAGERSFRISRMYPQPAVSTSFIELHTTSADPIQTLFCFHSPAVCVLRKP